MNLDRFSDRAVLAVSGARDYAVDLRHRRILPSHLLVATLAWRQGAPFQLIGRLGADPERIEQKAHADLLRLARDASEAPRWDESALAVLEEARRHADRLRDDLVRTHHLLLALADGNHGVARKALQEAGVTRAAIEYMMRDFRDAAAVEKRAAPSRTTPEPLPGGTPPPAQPGRASSAATSAPAAEGSILAQFGRDLTELSRRGELDPVIGRDAEIRRLVQVIGRRTKNNPVLVGEAGVGKTAIVEGFAHRLASGDVPSNLRDRRLVELDIGAMVAGTSLRGQFEERMRRLVREVAESQGQVILYIDEIHMIVGAGGSDNGGASGLLKPALARGEITLIGTTTPAEYRKYIEADKALERRFQEFEVLEPSQDEAIAILRGIKHRFELHHRVQVRDSAIQAAVRLSQRYVMERLLPDKAVDLIDEACSRLRMQIDSQPTVIDEMKRRLFSLEIEKEALKQEKDASSARAIERIDAEIARTSSSLTELQRHLDAEKAVLDRIMQSKAEVEATQKLVDRAQQENDLGRAAELKYSVMKELEAQLVRHREELAAMQKEHRLLKEEVSEEDIAVVVGDWTGVPVSRMMESERQKLLAVAERLSDRVIGQEPAVQAISAAVRRSRAGLQDRNRPIGNFFFVGPTGVGKTELAKALAEFLFDAEDALIRIDMSEYMDPAKVNTLIGAAFGYVDSDRGGILTEAVRRRPYSVVLFDEAEKAHPDVFNILLQVLDEGRLTDSQGRRIDFTNTIIILTSNVGARQILDLCGTVPYEEMDRQVHLILRDHFKPEFLNRLDDTIVFNALDRGAMSRILSILLKKLDRMLADQGLRIRFTDAAREHLLETGFQPEYGARPLKRALLTEVQDPLAFQILEGAFRAGDEVLAEFDPSTRRLRFTSATSAAPSA